MADNPLLKSKAAAITLTASDWYHLAVEKGHREAAAAWYRKAVERGEINADGKYLAAGG